MVHHHHHRHVSVIPVSSSVILSPPSNPPFRFSVVVALMTFFHKQIIDWLTPAGKWLYDRSWGWIIAVVIIFALSTPPLFGNEVSCLG
jgi:hypothetical protein